MNCQSRQCERQNWSIATGLFLSAALPELPLNDRKDQALRVREDR